MIDNYLERTRILIKQKRYAQAEEEARSALAIDPEDPEALTLYAYTQFYQRRFQVAIDWATKAAGQIEGYYWPYYIIAESQRQLQNDKKAMEAIRAGLQVAPDASCFYGIKSLIQFENGRRKAAIKTVEEGLRHNPLETQLLRLKTIHLYRQQKYAQAHETLAVLLQEEPDMCEAHNLKGWLALDKNNLEGAEAGFREALRLNPLFRPAHKGLVLSLAGRKWWYKTALLFERWRHREPNGYLGFGFLYLLLMMFVSWSFPWSKWLLFNASLLVAVICFPALTQAAATCYVRSLPIGKSILSEKSYNSCWMQLALSLAGLLAVFLVILSF